MITSIRSLDMNPVKSVFSETETRLSISIKFTATKKGSVSGFLNFHITLLSFRHPRGVLLLPRFLLWCLRLFPGLEELKNSIDQNSFLPLGVKPLIDTVLLQLLLTTVIQIILGHSFVKFDTVVFFGGFLRGLLGFGFGLFLLRRLDFSVYAFGFSFSSFRRHGLRCRLC